MTKWTYDYLINPSNEEVEEFGLKGWEMCGINNGRFWFKMPKLKEKNVAVSDSVLDPQIDSIIAHLNKAIDGKYTLWSVGTRKCIKARLNDGFTTDDFYAVINCKATEWLGTDMEKYLRPETLFGNKFEGYLQYARANEPKEPINPAMKGMVL